MSDIYIIYDDCEDMVLYNGESKGDGLVAVQNHILDGCGEIDNVHFYKVEKELRLRINSVDIVEE